MIIPLMQEKNPKSLNLAQPSPSSDHHEQGGLPSNKHVAIVLRMDFLP